MKFLLSATLVTAAYAQLLLNNPSQVQIAPPIIVYQDQQIIQTQTKKEQIKVNQQINTNTENSKQVEPELINQKIQQEIIQPIKPIIEPIPIPLPEPILTPQNQIFNKEQSISLQPFPIPTPAPIPIQNGDVQIQKIEEGQIIVPSGLMPGEQQLNPSIFEPKQQTQNKHKKHHSQKKKKHKKHLQYTEQNPLKQHHKNKKKHHKKHNNLKHEEQQQNPPQNYLDYEGWQKYVQRKHKKGKYHKGLWIYVAFIAFFCTLLGMLLGRCIRNMRKCPKNKKHSNYQKKSSTYILNEIKQSQNKIQQLKAEYLRQKSEEQRISQRRYQQEVLCQSNRNREIQLKQIIQPQPYQQNDIPTGIPINVRY